MQLDFLNIGQSAPQEQFDLFGGKPKAAATYESAEKFFQTLSPDEVALYRSYWGSIAPRDDSQRFQRWLFAFLSVHSTWTSNVAGYEALKDWTQWFNQWDVLKQKIEDSRVGLNNMRFRFLKEFAVNFWKNPVRYTKGTGESWREYRDRLEQEILGLGFAKVSFALEMLYPNEAEVACMDVHLFRLYGLHQNRDRTQGKAIEGHFVQMSKLWNTPPAIARAILWDRKQNQTNSRYWSYVLEG
jgi:hypothetical protein